MRRLYIHNLVQFPMVCGHFAPFATQHVEYYVLPHLGPQNATSPPIAPSPSEIAESNERLQTNANSPPKSPQPISPSHLSGDHTHHLERLLDSSLATDAVHQFSGNTLADILTPRVYDTFKALYALAVLDAAASITNPRGNEIPNRSNFPDIGNDCPYLSNRSPPFPNSNLAVPRTGGIHISISVDNVMLFLWAGLAAVSFFVVFFNFPRFCERDATGLF